jgi:uncharacterized protein (TIGR02145 family)
VTFLAATCAKVSNSTDPTGADGRSKRSLWQALLSGYRNNDGSFNNPGSNTNFWSSSQYDATNAWNRNLNSGNTNVNRNNNNKTNGVCGPCRGE